MIVNAVAALSTKLSTAALDKHPQSKARGITLDLGFSSFSAGSTQFTLVDCPGHASLVKTVVGGSQIIDMMLLVVDVTKGIQPQTAECIVIGEITTGFMIVALNKIDLIPVEHRDLYLKKATKMIRKTLQGTRFKDAAVIPVSTKGDSPHIQELVNSMVDMVHTDAFVTSRKYAKEHSKLPFCMHVDHCFAIKGQGTVITGTISEGQLSVGQSVEFPLLGMTRKVKSIQSFKVSVPRAFVGDRVGACISNMQPSTFERGVVCEPGSMTRFTKALARVDKIRFYPGQIKSNRKLHILMGHASHMGHVEFFGMPRYSSREWVEKEGEFAFENEYIHQEELYGIEGRIMESESWYASSHAILRAEKKAFHGPQWALITFDEQVIARENALVIGAKLDMNPDTCMCRMAMSGKIVKMLRPEEEFMLRLYKLKCKQGTIAKVEGDGRTAICSGLFHKHSVMTMFIGMKVRGPDGTVGTLKAPYGSDGQCRILFNEKVHSGGDIQLKYKKFVKRIGNKSIEQ
jgi:selenocysteine-specific elongation factor